MNPINPINAFFAAISGTVQFLQLHCNVWQQVRTPSPFPINKSFNSSICPPKDSVRLGLSGYACQVISVRLCLSGYACQVMPVRYISVRLFLSGYACQVMPVRLCLSGYACKVMPVRLSFFR